MNKLFTAIAICLLVGINYSKAQIAWPQNGTSIFYNGGNVGIGTTSPVAKLEILSGTSNNEIARFGGTLSERGLRLSSFVVNGTNEVGFNFDAPGAGGGAAISFSTLSTERMRISYNGNVGIGTTTPGKSLHITKNVANGVGASLLLQNENYATNVGAETEIILSHLTDNGNPFRFAKIHTVGANADGTVDRLSMGIAINNTSYADMLTIKYNGNVGIGTTTPYSKLHVQASSGSTDLARFFNSDYATGVGSGFRIYTGSATGDTYTSLQAYTAGATTAGTLLLNSIGGNVGIGTTSPRSRLDLGTSVGANKGLRVGDYIEINERETVNNASVIGFNTCIDETDVSKFKPTNYGSSSANGMLMTMASGGDASIDFYGTTWGTSNTPKPLTDFTHVIRFSTNGNVGIGTTSPTAKLEVYSSSTEIAKFKGINNYNYGTFKILGGTNNNPYWRGVFIGANIKMSSTYPEIETSGYRAAAIGFGTDAGEGHIGFFTTSATTSGNVLSENMRISPSGNVGIGITNPQYKLTVEGTIAAREVKVTAEAWADFVFHPSYRLRSLDEVEQYIKANSHLPEIPSEKEVKEQGISVGEMNAKLLQKVEELTLYLIDQQKQINELKEQNLKLSKGIETIKR